MNTPLTLTELQNALDAAETFTADNGDCGLAFETILSLCFIKQLVGQQQAAPRHPIAQAIAARMAGTSTPEGRALPDWFAEGIKRFAGSRVTAAQVMAALERPTDIGSLRTAGAWLRALCGEPIRSGGRILFTVPGAPASRPAEDIDPEDPFAHTIPLASRVLTFAALHPGERYTPEAIAQMLGHKGTPQECTTIGVTLTREGYAPDQDGAFTLAKVR